VAGGLVQRHREHVAPSVVDAVELERGDDRAVQVYLVGLEGAEDDALDERGGLELVWERGCHGRVIDAVAVCAMGVVGIRAYHVSRRGRRGVWDT